MSAKRLHAYTLLLIVAIVWGIAGPVIKFTERGIPPLPFLSYRFGLAALFTLIFLVFGRNKKVKSMKDLFELVLYGLLAITFGLGLLFWGLEHTSVLEMNLITSTSPLITSILGVKMLGEHVTKREKIGLSLALLGTLITIFSTATTDKIHVFGNLLVFSYVVLTAFSAVVSKKLLRKGYNGFFISNISFLVGFITIAAFAIYKLGLPVIVFDITHLDIQYHLGVWYMAFLSGVLGYGLVNVAQKSIEIGEGAVFGYLLPVFGIPTAILWLGEKFTPNLLLGGIIIALGVFVAETKKNRYN